MNKLSDEIVLKEQKIITKCIFKGMSSAEIAKKLNYSLSTISNRINSIFVKYNVKNRFDFVIAVLSDIILKCKKEIIILENKNIELNNEISSLKKLLKSNT